MLSLNPPTSTKQVVRAEHQDQNNAYRLYRFDQYKLSIMPSNCASNNIDFVQPTQYNVQLNRVLKEPPWSLGRCPILNLSTSAALI